MGNAVQPVKWTYYKGIMPIPQLPQHLCVTELFSCNTFPSVPISALTYASAPTAPPLLLAPICPHDI